MIELEERIKRALHAHPTSPGIEFACKRSGLLTFFKMSRLTPNLTYLKRHRIPTYDPFYIVSLLSCKTPRAHRSSASMGLLFNILTTDRGSVCLAGSAIRGRNVYECGSDGSPEKFTQLSSRILQAEKRILKTEEKTKSAKQELNK